MEKIVNKEESIIEKAAKIISEGGIIVLPFDTVYGFACSAYSDTAIAKVAALKDRAVEKTVGTATHSVDKLSDYVKLTFPEFIKTHLPGKFTFIFPVQNMFLSKYCYKNDTLGIRIPDDQFVCSIIEKVGGIIAQTSANKSGQNNCLSVKDIKQQFNQNELDSIDLVIDGGQLEKGQPSEIFDLTGAAPKKIER